MFITYVTAQNIITISITNAANKTIVETLARTYAFYYNSAILWFTTTRIGFKVTKSDSYKIINSARKITSIVPYTVPIMIKKCLLNFYDYFIVYYNYGDYNLKIFVITILDNYH